MLGTLSLGLGGVRGRLWACGSGETRSIFLIKNFNIQPFFFFSSYLKYMVITGAGVGRDIIPPLLCEGFGQAFGPDSGT